MNATMKLICAATPRVAFLLLILISTSISNAAVVYWSGINISKDSTAFSPLYSVFMETGQADQLAPPYDTGEGRFLFGDSNIGDPSSPSAGFMSAGATWITIATRGLLPPDYDFMQPAAARFDQNQIIDGTDPTLWNRSWALLQTSVATAPEWDISADLVGYIGIQFTLSSDTHYGWAKVIRSQSVFTLVDLAYESDANVGIHAGAVPEPHSLTLLLLALLIVTISVAKNSKQKC